jgi:hypothetical protein
MIYHALAYPISVNLLNTVLTQANLPVRRFIHCTTYIHVNTKRRRSDVGCVSVYLSALGSISELDWMTTWYLESSETARDTNLCLPLAALSFHRKSRPAGPGVPCATSSPQDGKGSRARNDSIVLSGQPTCKSEQNRCSKREIRNARVYRRSRRRRRKLSVLPLASTAWRAQK